MNAVYNTCIDGVWHGGLGGVSSSRLHHHHYVRSSTHQLLEVVLGRAGPCRWRCSHVDHFSSTDSSTAAWQTQRSFRRTISPDSSVIIAPMILWSVSFKQILNFNIHIHLVSERFIVKIHQNTTNYFYIVDISVSIRDLPLIEIETSTT